MNGIRFQSNVVDEEVEVGDFPILGKGMSAHPNLAYLRCPALPDLCINACDSTSLIMCLLMLKKLIPVNILYIAIPFALSMLGDTLLAPMICNFCYRPSDERGEVAQSLPKGVCVAISFIVFVLHSMRIYLIGKYIYALKCVLDETNSLVILTRPNIYLEVVVTLPSYFSPLDATFTFLLFLFGYSTAVFNNIHAELQRSQTASHISGLMSIDTTTWYLYMFICRCLNRHNEFAHFSMLIRNLPILYLALAIVRFCFCCFYKRRAMKSESAKHPWKTNARGIRLLLDTAVFISAIVFITLYFMRTTVDPFCYFIYLAVTERIVLSVLNVHLTCCYDANNDDGGGYDDGEKYPLKYRPGYVSSRRRRLLNDDDQEIVPAFNLRDNGVVLRHDNDGGGDDRKNDGGGFDILEGHRGKAAEEKEREEREKAQRKRNLEQENQERLQREAAEREKREQEDFDRAMRESCELQEQVKREREREREERKRERERDKEVERPAEPVRNVSLASKADDYRKVREAGKREREGIEQARSVEAASEAMLMPLGVSPFPRPANVVPLQIPAHMRHLLQPVPAPSFPPARQRDMAKEERPDDGAPPAANNNVLLPPPIDEELFQESVIDAKDFGLLPKYGDSPVVEAPVSASGLSQKEKDEILGFFTVNMEQNKKLKENAAQLKVQIAAGNKKKGKPASKPDGGGEQ